MDDSPEFEQWLLLERERLRVRAIETLIRLVGFCLGWGMHTACWSRKGFSFPLLNSAGSIPTRTTLSHADSTTLAEQSNPLIASSQRNGSNFTPFLASPLEFELY